jgi:hypothetical protein
LTKPEGRGFQYPLKEGTECRAKIGYPLCTDLKICSEATPLLAFWLSNAIAIGVEKGKRLKTPIPNAPVEPLGLADPVMES